jgi:hypothetical protein
MGLPAVRQVLALRSRMRSLLRAIAPLLVGSAVASAATISGNALTGIEGQPLERESRRNADTPAEVSIGGNNQ